MRITILFSAFFGMIAAAPEPAVAQSERPIVGVFKMEDLAGTGQSNTFSTMIETSIASTNKFRVMERARLSRLMEEQARAQGGVVTSNSPDRMGGFEGIDYLIYGTITSVSSTSKTDVGASIVGGLLGSRNSSCKKGTVRLEADIKITDANTGEVRYVTRIAETQEGNTVCDGDSQYDVSALMRSAADNIATGLVTTIYPIQVAAVQSGGIVVLNYGEGAMRVGDTLSLYEQGEAILDPATGEVLASNETFLGTVEVTDVQARISKARMISAFAQSPRVGSIARPSLASK
ncbi:CsgG/HfaB family protein [Sphingomicrobium sp. XHP0239]|uniref:CsgG/HfaB family protein n=1 Tax=Sphingomicrobium maritimum TaxID=3133972 RepID=UPI0031CC7366